MAVAIDKTNIFHVMSEMLGLFMGARVGVTLRNMDDPETAVSLKRLTQA